MLQRPVRRVSQGSGPAASNITKLNAPHDWAGWNSRLRGYFGIADLWAPITGRIPAPLTETAEHIVLQSHQLKLAVFKIARVSRARSTPLASSIFRSKKTMNRLHRALVRVQSCMKSSWSLLTCSLSSPPSSYRSVTPCC